jgi:phage repressor protein C with HTH and peptisase S24 domain
MSAAYGDADGADDAELIPMFTHAEVWRGIDRLARQHGLTPSGLARRAGLDPTTFNPSKRITKQDKPRWPSTESLAKILNATTTPFDDFVALMPERPGPARQAPAQRLRCVAMDHAEREGLFDDAGFPIGEDWDEIDFPNLEDEHAYALEIRGDVLMPTYRDGDLLILSPMANVRRHDRIVLKTTAGGMLSGMLVRRTAQRIELAPFAASASVQTFPIGEVAWLARILWVSQ